MVPGTGQRFTKQAERATCCLTWMAVSERFLLQRILQLTATEVMRNFTPARMIERTLLLKACHLAPQHDPQEATEVYRLDHQGRCRNSGAFLLDIAVMYP